MALDEILRSRVWDDYIFRDAEFFWQTSLLEPVGGMDNFVKAFARQSLMQQGGTIEGLVRFGAKVTAIEVASDKVYVAFEEPGGMNALAADYCISTIPMPIFKTLPTNLPNASCEASYLTVSSFWSRIPDRTRLVDAPDGFRARVSIPSPPSIDRTSPVSAGLARRLTSSRSQSMRGGRSSQRNAPTLIGR